MPAHRRTTLTAKADALDILAAEASRRGLSLSKVLAEAVEERAANIRKQRRPRVGVDDSEGRSPGAAVLTQDPVADDPAKWR
jgi:hypothetical protein